ncbi:hypothetical protein C8J57DRAFT_1067981 [Mycena rebaudengoi]|nr:hypothetical protein C8J57DRAFT_1067981 [Mycena rebaudengoi]
MSESSEASLTRVSDLWFSDANWVLQAGSSLFRVSLGILAAKSPVFQDMMSFPQPPDTELIDGCPVVHLPDSEEDTEFFLRAIFHYDFFEPYPADAEFEVVSGVLRLSQKYQVDHLRKRALLHLSARFPMALEDWKKRAHWTAYPIDVVNIAREVSADWILPLALYRCCEDMHLTELVEGDSITGSKLSPQDTRLCLQNVLAFHTLYNSCVLDFLLTPPSIPGCLSVQQCISTRMLRRQRYDRVRRQDILPLTIWQDGSWTSLSVCNPCMTHMKQSHAAAVQTFWDGLPAAFGLPNWGSLEALKEAALQ